MRNKLKTLVLSVFILLSSLCYSQLEEGNYTYSDEEINVGITVIDDGNVVKSLLITFKDGSMPHFTGVWQDVPDTADEDYNGPEGWYVLYNEDDGCGFEIQILSETKIKLTGIICTDKKYERKYLTTKEKILLLK